MIECMCLGPVETKTISPGLQPCILVFRSAYPHTYSVTWIVARSHLVQIQARMVNESFSVKTVPTDVDPCISGQQESVEKTHTGRHSSSFLILVISHTAMFMLTIVLLLMLKIVFPRPEPPSR